MTTAIDADQVAKIAEEVVAEHDPKQVPLPDFLGACYDAGLSWVHFPEAWAGWVPPVDYRAWPTTSCRVPAARYLLG